MNIDIDIIESTDQITNKILRALLPDVNTYFQKVFDKCKNNISSIISQAIAASPEYQSIQSGKLQYEFGLPDSGSRLSEILAVIQQNITVEYNKPQISKNIIIGSFDLNMIPSDYSNLLSLSSAVLTTEKGSQLEWLKWLLLFGDKTIIKEYVVKIGSNPRSRTGNAIMVGQTSGRWSVPVEFAGTKNNNWITRAIDSVNNDVVELLNNSLKGTS